MSTHHILALIFFGIVLIALFIQTARAAYWRGAGESLNRMIRGLDEEIHETHRQRDAARKDAQDAELYTREICDRLMLAANAPEAYEELLNVNNLLRSLHAVVKRQGTDTNWDSIQERLEERLDAQEGMLHIEGT